MTTTNNSLNISLSGQTGTGTVVGSTTPTIATPVVSGGLTASGSGSNDFSASTGTFKTSSGANQLSGAVTIADATTPSLTTAAGKTNTGFVQINGKTSGALKITAADAAAQTVTVSLAAQTVGAATLTIPDMANTNKTVAWLESPTLTTPSTSGVTTLGAGLLFPAVQVPSADPNCLDDYEEGTWNPTVSDASTGGNTASGGVFRGRYTKIGDCVHYAIVLANIATVGMTAGNALFVQGFPFTIGSTASSNSIPGSVQGYFITFTGSYLAANLAVTTTYCNIQTVTNAGAGATSFLVSGVTSGTAYIYLRGSYFI